MRDDDMPGYPLSSGMRRLSDEEQEEARRQHRELQRRIEPVIKANEDARRWAMEHWHERVIG